MKKTKKPHRKHFRYLTNEDIKNPLYAVAHFCRTETDLISWKDDVKSLIKESNITCGKISTSVADARLFNCNRILRHIELLYVLHTTIADWLINDKSRFYKIERMTGQVHKHWYFTRDDTLDDMLHFKQFTAKEVGDFSIFLKNLFEFKTLRQWQQVIDDLLTSVLGQINFSEFTAYWGTEQKKIFKYLKKIAEAIFFVYVLKAKEHIFKYHTKYFHFEGHLGREQLFEDNASALVETAK